VLKETRWQVFWCDPDAGWTDFLTDPLLVDLPSLAEFVGSKDNRAGQPFLLRSALAADLPAAVLADLLGMHINTAVRWVKYVGPDWADYIAARAIEQG
jgi:hypothetical protein